MSFLRLFEKVSHAEYYRRFRPTYPPALYEKILSFLREKRSPPYDLHLDIGCGSGQGTHGMSSHFQKVIGFDISEVQIKAATEENTASNVVFKVSPAENLPIEDEKVDLITSATAAHYFDFKSFCREADRVLKPNGCLAAFTYGVPYLLHDDKTLQKTLNDQVNELMFTTIGSLWDEKVELIVRGYVDLNIPFPDFVRDTSNCLEFKWSLSQLMGYFLSTSACQKYLDIQPSSQIINEYQKKFLSVISSADASPDEVHLHVVFPIFLIMGRKSDYFASYVHDMSLYKTGMWRKSRSSIVDNEMHIKD